jgi:hypothetical protein
LLQLQTTISATSWKTERQNSVSPLGAGPRSADREVVLSRVRGSEQEWASKAQQGCCNKQIFLWWHQPKFIVFLSITYSRKGKNKNK